MYNACALFVLSHAALALADRCSSNNLLRNGGFEAHTDSVKPWVNNGKPPKIFKPGHHSKQAAGISSVSDYSGTELLQSFPSCPGIDWYLFELDHYFASPTNSTSSCGLSFFTANLQFYANSGPSDNGTWTTNRQLFPAGKSGVDLSISNTYDGGLVKVDNVKIVPFGNVAAKSGAAELLKNSGFEKSTLSPWQGHTKTCSLVSPGAYNKPGQAVRCKIGSFEQDIKTVPGQLYELTFDYKFQIIPHGGQPASDQYCAIDYDISGRYQFFGPSLDHPFLLRNNTWHTSQQAFLAESNLTNIFFDLYRNYKQADEGMCLFYLDNISAKEAQKT